MLQYHHCIDLEKVVFGEIKGNPKYSNFNSDVEFFKESYLWLEKEVRFYPLFLAVGTTEEDIRMTGYQNQWAKLLVESKDRNEYRKKGEFPNYVLFSFQNIEGIFMDYDGWHLVLNASYKNYQMTNYEKRLIFKRSWSKSKWLRKTRKQHSVQLVTSKLYLPFADRIWVRNKKTKTILENMGFRNVEVKRILLEEF